MSLDRWWAGWRLPYLEQAADEGPDDEGEGSIFERILGSDRPDRETYVVHRGERVAALLNAYPYTSGHLLVMPYRAVPGLGDLDADEFDELWSTVRDAVAAIEAAYDPDGVNVGLNLGAASGAGVPGHLHVHCLPRWAGDTNFMTSVAETRIMPEALDVTWERLRAAWPA